MHLLILFIYFSAFIFDFKSLRFINLIAVGLFKQHQQHVSSQAMAGRE
jgi:hypothetical protein